VSKPSAFQVKTLTEKLGCYTSAGSDHTAAELTAGQHILRHKLINFLMNDRPT